MKMNIVVVDGATLNPGDLSWAMLGTMGAYVVYANSAPDELIERCRQADAVLTNKVAFTRATIAALPRLKYIGVSATGFNIVDIAAAGSRGIVVTNVPTYGTNSVAQMTFALLLELTQRVGYHSQTVHDGRWAKSDSFCYWDYPLIELAGLTMGVVGCGRIGRTVARLAAAFGMQVLGYDAEPITGEQDIITQTNLDDLFRLSDVISLHCPLTPATEKLINAPHLRGMKKTAFLINTSRGALIDEHDLAVALNEGWIAGAGVDVLSTEPPAADNPLLHAKNCFITPHISWATRAARERLLQASIDNLRAYVAGEPQNVVSPG